MKRELAAFEAELRAEHEAKLATLAAELEAQRTAEIAALQAQLAADAAALKAQFTVLRARNYRFFALHVLHGLSLAEASAGGCWKVPGVSFHALVDDFGVPEATARALATAALQAVVADGVGGTEGESAHAPRCTGQRQPPAGRNLHVFCARLLAAMGLESHDPSLTALYASRHGRRGARHSTCAAGLQRLDALAALKFCIMPESPEADASLDKRRPRLPDCAVGWRGRLRHFGLHPDRGGERPRSTSQSCC